MYNIDIPKFVKRNITDALRKPIAMAYVRSLLAPFGKINEWLAELRALLTEEYRWNGTVHSLEKQLNDFYDPVLRRIYITMANKLPIYFWKDEGEQPDLYWKDEGDVMDGYWLDTDQFNEQQATGWEFTIYIHASTSFIPEQLLEKVEIYRWAGYRPRLVRYGIGIEEEVETIPGYE